MCSTVCEVHVVDERAPWERARPRTEPISRNEIVASLDRIIAKLDDTIDERTNAMNEENNSEDVKPTWRARLWDFIKRTAVAVKNKIVEFVVGVYHHTEAIIVCTAAAIGVDALLSRLPFVYNLPMWIEAPWVIPVVSVVIVGVLLWNGERRANRREAKKIQRLRTDMMAGSPHLMEMAVQMGFIPAQP
jgi:hypothetical protein